MLYSNLFSGVKIGYIFAGNLIFEDQVNSSLFLVILSIIFRSFLGGGSNIIVNPEGY
jgi:hypothetical protein